MGEEDISIKATRLASNTASFMNLLALLASPRLSVKVTEWTSREHLLEHADGFLEFVGDGKTGGIMSDGKPIDLQGAIPYTLKLRELFATWEPSSDVLPDIRDNARALLHAFDIPEPPGGWDSFEGWPDHDAPDADAGKGEQGGAE